MKPRKKPERKFATAEQLKRKYWDAARAERYTEKHFSDLLGARRNVYQTRIINRFIQILRPHTVVDLGVGSGRLAKGLTGFQKGIGIDSSRKMLEVARREVGKKWELQHGDAFHLPFADGSVDLVVSTKLIWQFSHEDRKRLYEELRRVLGPEKYLIFDPQNRRTVPTYKRKPIDPAQSYHTHGWSRREFIEEMEQNGFIVEKMAGVMNSPRIQGAISRIAKGKRTRITERLIDAAERIRAGQPVEWLAMCRKA